MSSDDAVIASLLARLDRADSIEAARAVVVAYGRAADARDWDALGATFAEKAVLLMGPTEVVGRAAVVTALREMLPEGLGTMHAMINPTVTPMDDGRLRVDTTIIYTHASSGSSALGWGSYVDLVSVVDGKAEITEKSFTAAGHGEVRPGWGPESDDEARLERLETAERAREAVLRYAIAIDTVDLELLETVFTPEAVLTTRRGLRTGREAILAYYRDALADPVARKHFIVNQQVEWVAPGEAVVRSYLLYTFAGDDTSIIGWGCYVDRVQVIDDVGRISGKVISVDAHSDSRHGWSSGPVA